MIRSVHTTICYTVHHSKQNAATPATESRAGRHRLTYDRSWRADGMWDVVAGLARSAIFWSRKERDEPRVDERAR
jgi:hypothetical protein